jgi:MFS-type transporter involved in bile tolerance (Atg22 family)
VLVIARLAVTVLLTPAVLVVAARSIRVGLREHMSAMWRASAAVAVMASAVLALNQVLDINGPVRLGLDVFAGAAIYVVSLVLLWNASGRPVSAEQDLVALLAHGWNGLQTIRARAPNVVR